MKESNGSPRWSIVEANSPPEVDVARALFVEYAESLGFSLCFQGFDQELAGLPGVYARPRGRLLLARSDSGSWDGVIGLRPFEQGALGGSVGGSVSGNIGEIKRLYVRPTARGASLGRRLVKRLISDARTIGYETLRLDTVQSMTAAIALYQSLGFAEINASNGSPLEGVRYFELALAP